MSKRLVALCTALAVFAVVPSMASANPVITDPTGTVLSLTSKTCNGVAGVCIRAHNVGEVNFTTSTGILRCSSAELTGVLKKNNTAEGIQSEITSVKVGGTGATAVGEPAPECTGSNFFTPNLSFTPNPGTNGLPWCVTASGTTDAVTIAGGPCGAARAIRFILAITGVGTCTYQRAAASPVNATLDTDIAPTNSDALITVSEQGFPLLEGTSGLCPEEGKLDMTFTLETDVEGTAPVWFSGGSTKPVITDPTGTVLSLSGQTCNGVAGVCIRAHNVGETLLTASTGTLACTSDELTGVLKKNNTSEGIQAEITSAKFGGTGGTAAGEPAPECTGSGFIPANTSVTPNPATNGLPWCVTASGTTDAVTIAGGPCGAARPIRFILAITGVGTCTYQRTAATPVNATLDTDIAPEFPDALITVSEQGFPLLEGTSGLCPEEGKLDMTFTLETDVEGTAPVWFSS